ncbi:hypothetical protein LX32DRAFT_315210 [Colletotrichum zoysiae]|uniref:Uncharacterized protein n=1 Tax=Colletotrichum zoysiae TaxID=1216348 RepID=A0AAD9H198_9PEZI|nr:hypothetical protein LX32DRAFT_315210 [Colletotrichum zoysiae]
MLIVHGPQGLLERLWPVRIVSLKYFKAQHPSVSSVQIRRPSLMHSCLLFIFVPLFIPRLLNCWSHQRDSQPSGDQRHAALNQRCSLAHLMHWVSYGVTTVPKTSNAHTDEHRLYATQTKDS